MATVVSGDCEVSIGTAAGLQRAGLSPAIVWSDALGLRPPGYADPDGVREQLVSTLLGGV